jgi:hypothetical protein
MLAHVDDGLSEARIGHAGHRDQQLAYQVFAVPRHSVVSSLPRRRRPTQT